MALPINTSRILEFLGYVIDQDFSVGIDEAVISLIWLSASPQPTEQEIIDAGNDLTLVNGQTFSQWLEEHGGDAAKTIRRLAKEHLSDSKEESALIRAALLVIVDEFNNHSNKINEILDAIDASNNLADVKSNIGAVNDLPQRTGAQLRTATENKIASGESDT